MVDGGNVEDNSGGEEAVGFDGNRGQEGEKENWGWEWGWGNTAMLFMRSGTSICLFFDF